MFEIDERGPVMNGYTAEKDAYLKRLRRIEGQVRGIAKMVDDDKYCIDILTQVSAATSALENVALGLLDDHLGHCVAEAAAQGGDVANEKILRGQRRDREARQVLIALERDGAAGPFPPAPRSPVCGRSADRST